MGRSSLTHAHAAGGHAAAIAAGSYYVTRPEAPGQWVASRGIPVSQSSRAKDPHSITTSAPLTSEGGTVTPRAFAALRFTNSSTFVTS